MNWDINAEENKKILENLSETLGDHAHSIDYQIKALCEAGFSVAQIGKILGLSESQVRNRMFYDPKELGPFKNFDSAFDIWQAIRKEKHTITCSQKYGNLSKITKWLMERGTQFYVDDYQAQLDDEAGYKIHLIISEAELAGLDEYMGKGSFVYVE